jgi:hypothetical protein
MTKKLYKHPLNPEESLGINLDSVVAFWVDGDIDTYHGKYERTLHVIVVAAVQARPSEIARPYYTFVFQDGQYVQAWDAISRPLYDDLVAHFGQTDSPKDERAYA